MNTLNFNQSVGFPLETDILDAMQTAYKLFNALGSIAGEKSILSGCVTTGDNVTDGVIYLNGEVLEFRGGFAQTDVVIQEEITSLEFEDGNYNEVVKVRFATFGTSGTSYPWADFKRGYATNLLQPFIEKLNGIEAEAQKNVTPNYAQNIPSGPGYIANKPTNLVKRAGNIYGFAFYGTPSEYWEINHMAGTLDYVVAGEFVNNGIIDVGNIPIYGFSVWDKTINSCRIKVKKLSAEPNGNMKANFKIIY